MLIFTRVQPVVKRVVPVIVLIALLWYFTHAGKEYADRAVTKMRDKKTVFLETFIENDIGPPIDGSGLAHICSQKPRNTALVFSCDTAKEGFASVRQHQLQCIRLGIESGGELWSSLVPAQLRQSTHTGFLSSIQDHPPQHRKAQRPRFRPPSSGFGTIGRGVP